MASYPIAGIAIRVGTACAITTGDGETDARTGTIGGVAEAEAVDDGLTGLTTAGGGDSDGVSVCTEDPVAMSRVALKR